MLNMVQKQVGKYEERHGQDILVFQINFLPKWKE
jgi:hypothetical protein